MTQGTVVVGMVLIDINVILCYSTENSTVFTIIGTVRIEYSQV